MNVLETINQKVTQLPPDALEEVLEVVEKIEKRYSTAGEASTASRGEKHVLDLLAEIQIDGPPDLSERHHEYAWGKLKD